MKRASIGLLLVFLIPGVAASPVFAREKARIRDLSVFVDKGSVGVSFSVENGLSPKIERTVQNGVPVSIFFFVRLCKSKKLWKDKKLVSLIFTRRIRYDPLKKVYEVFLEETSPPAVFENFWEAKKSLVSVRDVRLIPRRPLSDRATYYVSVKAELEPVRLPFGLENILFFVPSAQSQTGWLVQRFRIGSFVFPKQGGANNGRDASAEDGGQAGEPQEKK